MDSDQHINSDMTTISENNLGGVLFPDFGSGNLILTSDIGSTLSSFEGALCFDESNELVYVNMPIQMIPSGINNSDSLPNSSSVFSSYSNSIPSLSDLPLFNDGGQVMLLTGGSIVIPNDDNDLVSTNSDPYVLEYVLNASQSNGKVTNSKISDATTSAEIRKSDEQRNSMCLPSSSNGNMMSKNYEIMEVEDDNLVKREIKHTCKLCSDNFYSLRDYRKHLSTHKDQKMHQCKCCEASFNKINNLILHEVTHTNETKCPLSNCQKKFNRKASMKAHIKLHEEDESLTCTECGEEFRNQLYLELHYKYQSQCRISNSEPIVVPRKTYLCKICNRNFEDLELFNVHKKEHEKLKKALATKSHKKKVVPAVPNSRINRCKICPKWFLKPSQLLRHMRIHTGERPFVCDVCSKAFNQANSLKIHMLKHTGDRPFQCPFCLTSFSQRGNLRQHINRVHSIPKLEENVYKCSECPCIFKKMCSLNAHKNRVHQQRYYAAEEKSDESKRSTNCGETAIIIENGADDVNDEDMSLLLDKDSDINTISINFDNGNGTVCNQKVFVKKKGNTRFYACSHCPKQNVKLKEIIRHLKFSILGKSFKCDYCSKMFSQQPTFMTHLTLHATAKTYQCSTCSQSFSNPTEMKIHSKSHTEIEDQQMCINCFKTLSSSEVENHHCISFISDIDETVNLESLEEATEISDMVKVRDTASLILPPYDCKYCKIAFESYAKLKQHLHGIHDAVICETCCLEFPNKEKFKEHQVSHHEEEIRDRTCSKCDKQFRTKYRRDMHYKSHFKDSKNDVECHFRTQMFKDESSLNKHVKQPHVNDKMPKSNIGNDDLRMPVNENCDIDLSNGLDDAVPFTSDDVYVPCNATSISSTKIQSIGITDSGTFSVSDASAFTTTSTSVTHSNNNDFTTNDSAIFIDAQIRANEDVGNPVDLASDSLKTELLENSNSNLSSQELTLDSINDHLFDFPSSVIPVEVTSADAESSNDLLNVAGAVIYRNAKSLQQNFAEIDLQKQFQEAECSNDTNTLDSYIYACNTCYLTFKTLQTLLRHLQTHDGSKSFECLYCGTENKTQAQLTHHIAQHSLQKEFPCVHCGELFDSLDVVKKHITDVHLMSSVDKKSEQKRKKNSGNELLLSEKEKIMIAGQKPHKYSSISEKVLSSLLKNNASMNAKGSTSDKEEKSTKKKKEGRKFQKENVCSYCSRGFKKMCDLVRHIRIHTGEKPFKCDYCNKCFTVKSILNCHLKTHFSVNNIFCHVCNRFFATVGSLKTHMRLHTGERPYKCLFCKETFRTSGHRDSHQKRHLGDKDKTKSKFSNEATLIEIEDNGLDMNLEPTINIQDSEYIISDDIGVQESFKFQDIDLTDLSNLPSNRRTNNCAVCRKVFKKKSDLDRHMNTHMNEKGFNCALCDSKFNQLNTFKTHLLKHANDQLWTCDICNSSFASSKNLKVHKVRHHPESLNMPIKDADVKQKEVVETDKDMNKWTINAEIFSDKMTDLKKYDNVSDFYIIDKHFDLNSMMQDLFPDDGKE